MSAFLKYVAAEAVGRVVELIRDGLVLDVGCGDGFVTSLLAQHARAVHGVDINARAIAFAELIVDKPGVSFETVDDGFIRELVDNVRKNVDVITAFELVEHLTRQDRDDFLLGASEVLSRSNGRLIITTPNGRRRSGGSPRNPYHTAEYAPQELIVLLENAGFTQVHLEGVYLQPPWPRLEHFANTVPFRTVFRSLARAGSSHPRLCRTLLCWASPRH